MKLKKWGASQIGTMIFKRGKIEIEKNHTTIADVIITSCPS